MIKPAPGYAFIVEDAEDFSNLEKLGLDMPEEAMRGVGSVGTILSVTHEQQGFFPWLRYLLFAERVIPQYRKGQRVIFDRFVASDILYREKGIEVERLKSVAIDCILGICE